MPLNIEQLARAGQFSVTLPPVGLVHCASLTNSVFSEAKNRVNDNALDPNEFARWLLGELGHLAVSTEFKEADPIESPVLTAAQLVSIDKKELESFALALVKKNSFLIAAHGGGNIQQASDEAATSFLVRAIIHHATKEKAKFESLVASIKKPFFQESTLDSIRRTMSASSSFQELAKKYASSALDISKPIVGSENFDISRARMLEPLPNPTLETNRLLREAAAHLQELRPLVAEGAQLIQSMNDTALRMQADYIENSTQSQKETKRATRIAAIGLIVSAIGIFISLYSSYQSDLSAKASEKANEEQIKVFQTSIENLVTVQREEIKVLQTALNRNKKSIKALPRQE